MEHISSMWSATSKPKINRPSLDSDITADVVIIGGGFTGLASAYFLEKKGLNTVILEKHKVGWGASGRNAGILTPGYKNNFFSMTKRLGESGTKELMNISVDSIKMIKKIVDENKIDCSLKNNGHLTPAFKKEHYNKLAKKQSYMSEKFGYETQLVNNEQMKNELNSTIYHGALLDPNAYAFHPLNYALGLAEVVEEHGGKIYEHSNVIKIEEKENKVIAYTEKGKVTAGHLIVGTNGYTTEVTKILRQSLISIGSYMVATEPVSDEVKYSILPKNRSATDTKNMLYYFRFSEDNRFLFGGRVSFKKKMGEYDDKFYDTIQNSMVEAFPEMQKYNIDYKWGGLTAFTRDFYPQIGRTGNRIHFALGYCGRGASFATFMGWLLSERITDQEKDNSVLEQLPLKQIPLYNMSSKLVNVVGMYYRLLDKIS